MHINTYIVEGSMDAFMWQTLERKARFVDKIMRSDLDVRELDDIGDTALSYAEVKALASGDLAHLDKANADADLAKYTRLATRPTAPTPNRSASSTTGPAHRRPAAHHCSGRGRSRRPRQPSPVTDPPDGLSPARPRPPDLPAHPRPQQPQHPLGDVARLGDLPLTSPSAPASPPPSSA